MLLHTCAILCIFGHYPCSDAWFLVHNMFILVLVVVVNSDGKLQQCVQQMDAIIQAEKCKRQRLYPLD